MKDVIAYITEVYTWAKTQPNITNPIAYALHAALVKYDEGGRYER